MEDASIGDKIHAHETNENILVGGLKSCTLNNTLQVVTLSKTFFGDRMLWTSGCETRVVALDQHYAPFNTLLSLKEEQSRDTAANAGEK